MRDTSFHDYVVNDLFADAPDITSKPMFGGWGVYRGGYIFAIISDGELYFKVDDTNRAEFEHREGSRIFSYEKQGKTQTISYWLVTEDVLEDRKRLYELSDLSVAISKRRGRT